MGTAATLSAGAHGDVLLRLKVVPGASRDEVVGAHGDRLKVKVAAPPEKGRATAAVLALLASRLGLSPQAVRLVSGPATPLKVVGVRGLSLLEIARRLGLPAPS